MNSSPPIYDLACSVLVSLVSCVHLISLFQKFVAVVVFSYILPIFVSIYIYIYILNNRFWEGNKIVYM